MEVTVNVDEKAVHPMIQFYESRYQQVKEGAMKLYDEAKQIAKVISQLKYKELEIKPKSVVSSSTVTEDKEYSKEWSLNRKIQFIIGKNNKPLTSNEIASQLLMLDKSLAKDREKTIKNVSTILSIETGKIYSRVKEENKREFHYSLN